MKKVLIVGVSSFVGSNLAVHLRKTHRVYGTYHRNFPRIDSVPSFSFPIAPQAPIRDLLKLMKPDVVVYCAAEVDDTRATANPDLAEYINAQAPYEFAKFLDSTKGRFIFLSTSKIFSGRNGNYNESDPPSPAGRYGQAKYRGEEAIAKLNSAYTIRLGTIYGFGSYFHPSAIVGRVLKKMHSGESTGYISDEFRSFSSVHTVCEAIEELIHCRPPEHRLFHLAGTEKSSYYNFAQAVCRTFNFPENLVHPIKGANFSGKLAAAGGARGSDLSLDGNRFRETFGVRFPNLQDGLADLKSRLIQCRL